MITDLIECECGLGDCCAECGTHGIGHVLDKCRDICWHFGKERCPRGVCYNGEVGCCLKLSAKPEFNR